MAAEAADDVERGAVEKRRAAKSWESSNGCDTADRRGAALPEHRMLHLRTVVGIICTRAAGQLFRRPGQPPVLGEITAGILLGPTLFGQSVTDAVFPADVLPLLAALAGAAARRRRGHAVGGTPCTAPPGGPREVPGSGIGAHHRAHWTAALFPWPPNGWACTSSSGRS
uniref:hypothetical protein n=1 Tax=Streptomyces anthocyanicus TaxID=68174 RepID=UPI002F915D4C